MPFKLMDIRAAAPPVARPLELIETRIAALIAAPSPPNDAAIEALVHRDVRDITFAVLSPGALIDILLHSPQSLLAYRAARHWQAIPLKVALFGLDDLRRIKTPAARLARAVLGDVEWCRASSDERKLLLTRRVLKRIASGRVS